MLRKPPKPNISRGKFSVKKRPGGFVKKRPKRAIPRTKALANSLAKRRSDLRRTVQKGGAMVSRIKKSKLFTFSLTAFIRRKKDQIKRFFLKFEIVRYFCYKKKETNEFKKSIAESSRKTAELLIEGAGGAKNILSVKKTFHSIKMTVKSDYFINKDLIHESGGFAINIQNKSLSVVFDMQETKLIAKEIKMGIADVKSKCVILDVS